MLSVVVLIVVILAKKGLECLIIAHFGVVDGVDLDFRALHWFLLVGWFDFHRHVVHT